MSPEVIEGKAYEESADVYSLGIVSFLQSSVFSVFDKSTGNEGNVGNSHWTMPFRRNVAN